MFSYFTVFSGCHFSCKTLTSLPICVQINYCLIYYRYKNSYVFCAIKKSRFPFAVSIVDGPDPCRSPSNAFRVNTPPTINGHRFNYSVCVAPVFGAYPAGRDLIEWFEMTRVFGAEFFTIYNLNISKQLMPIFEHYKRQGILEILDWKPPFTTYAYGSQIPALHDCLHRHQGRAKFTAFIDLDEFITPRHPDDVTWTDMIKRLPDACSYSFRSSFFVRPKNNRSKTNFDQHTEKNSFATNSLILNSLEREDHIYPDEDRSKIIAKPDDICAFGIHSAHYCQTQLKHFVSPNIGMLQHYKVVKVLKVVTDDTALKYFDILKERFKETKLQNL